MNITEDMYTLAKKIVDAYENRSNEDSLDYKPILRSVTKEVGKQYYWVRRPWDGKNLSGMVTIIREGGSSRVKGWQVVYVDKELEKFLHSKIGIPYNQESPSTQFADDDKLFELVKE